MDNNQKNSFFDYDEYLNKNQKNNTGSQKKKNRNKKNRNRNNSTNNINSNAVKNANTANPVQSNPATIKPEPEAKKPVADEKEADSSAVEEEFKSELKVEADTEAEQKKDIEKEKEALPDSVNNTICEDNVQETTQETDNTGEKIKPEQSNNMPSANKNKSRHKEKKQHYPAEQQPIENIKKMLDEALDEDVSEIANLSSDSVDDVIPNDKSGAQKKFHFILGFLFSAFALIGLCSSIIFSVNKINNFADNTKQKNEFAEFIYPIVICDPAPFDQTVKLRNDTMITAAIWDIILYEDKSKYTPDYDNIIVPAVDVEQHATKLFGTGLSFKHESILGADVQFYYEEDINSYIIPSVPNYSTYSPVIEKITNDGDKYTLLVGYVPPTPTWLTMTSKETPTPHKYVNYIVSKHGDKYTLISIQEVANAETSHNSGL